MTTARALLGECTIACNATWGAINPPHDTVLDLHFTGDLPQPVFILAEVRGHTGDGGDVMNLVDVLSPAFQYEDKEFGFGMRLSTFLCACPLNGNQKSGAVSDN